MTNFDDCDFKIDRVSIRLVKDAPLMSEKRISCAVDAIEVIGKDLCELDREVICVLNLKSNGHPINCHFASVGALNNTISHPRELLKSSILSNAAQIVLMHNHPSGTLTPSEDDVRMTDRMARVCDLVGIPLVDHVILGGDNKEYFSFREKSMLLFPSHKYETDYHNIELPETMVAEQDIVRRPRRHR